VIIEECRSVQWDNSGDINQHIGEKYQINFGNILNLSLSAFSKESVGLGAFEMIFDDFFPMQGGKSGV